jgi:hypothetical protein
MKIFPLTFKGIRMLLSNVKLFFAERVFHNRREVLQWLYNSITFFLAEQGSTKVQYERINLHFYRKLLNTQILILLNSVLVEERVETAFTGSNEKATPFCVYTTKQRSQNVRNAAVSLLHSRERGYNFLTPYMTSRPFRTVSISTP